MGEIKRGKESACTELALSESSEHLGTWRLRASSNPSRDKILSPTRHCRGPNPRRRPKAPPHRADRNGAEAIRLHRAIKHFVGLREKDNPGMPQRTWAAATAPPLSHHRPDFTHALIRESLDFGQRPPIDARGSSAFADLLAESLPVGPSLDSDPARPWR